MFSPLRFRLILLLLVAFGAHVGLVAWHYVVQRADGLAQAATDLRNHTQRVADRHHAIRDRAEAILNGLLSSANMRPGSSAAACSAELAERLGREPGFSNLGWALPDGEIVCTAKPVTIPVNISDRSHFAPALASPHLVVGEVVVLRGMEGQRSVVFAKSIRNDQGQVSGVLNLTLDLDWLYRELVRTAVPEAVEIMVVDARGTIAAQFPDADRWVHKNIAPSPFFRRLAAGNGSGIFEVAGLAGDPQIVAQAALFETVSGPLRVAVSMPKATLEARAQRRALVDLGIGLAVLLTTLVFVIYWTDRFVLRPLSALSAAARRFGAGDVGARSGLPHSRDEMGQLATALDAATTAVAEREVRIGRARRALGVLYAGSQALYRAEAELPLLTEMCQIIVERGGYRFAVVSFHEPKLQVRIEPKAWWGVTVAGEMPGPPSCAYMKEGQMPTLAARAIGSGAIRACRDIATDPGFATWREAALARGFASNIVLPLTACGATFATLGIYSDEVGAFDQDETRLLAELANQLAAGICMLRTRAERDRYAVTNAHHTRMVEECLGQAIDAISATVEARDPHTVGHERRVGDLAVAIALELGLSSERIHGVRLAATVHDLGKIRVPAELLAKPDKLTDAEYELIKTHPQAGYDILKDVAFPWPIADIVLQHHERADGSGYPKGLRGTAILPEARIVAVADVVDAMTSDRPYRRGLGLAAAIAEIEQGCGTRYDQTVATACVRLIRERRFAFPA